MAVLAGRTAGLLLPTREQAISAGWDAAALLETAARAEALGLDSVWAGDSLTARPRLEPLTLLAAVAARTRRIAVGTAALTAVLRPPVLGAASVATLDRLAGGRLVLALGAGFPGAATEAEFAALGVPSERRLARLGTVVGAWRSAWLGALGPEFPRPARTTGPPLWLAGGGGSALRLTARAFDGWLPYLPTPHDYRRAAGTLDDLVAAAGRASSEVARGLYATVLVDGAPGEMDAWSRGYYGVPVEALAGVQAVVAGSLAACTERLAAFAEAGAGHLVLRVGSFATDRHLETVAELARRWRAM